MQIIKNQNNDKFLKSNHRILFSTYTFKIIKNIDEKNFHGLKDYNVLNRDESVFGVFYDYIQYKIL